MQNRKASIKETGEELSSAEWDRFDAAVADLKAERLSTETAKQIGPQKEISEQDPSAGPEPHAVA